MENYTHFTQEERERIYQLQQDKMGPTAIALDIGRDKSSISRELRRNKTKVGYLPDSAQLKYKNRRTHRKKKIETCPELKDYVVEKLKAKWSPEQIAGRMKKEQRNFFSSTETIYQFIYSAIGRSLLLYQYLRYGQDKRGQLHGRKNRSMVIKNRVSIHDRPAAIADRTNPGHFEGDLTFFTGNPSTNLTVLTERSSRFIMLVKNESKKADIVIHGIKQKVKNHFIKSITFDNGSEFVHHSDLQSMFGINTYFCDPGSPWQKGTVENSIARLHRFIGKGANINQWSDLEIEDIEAMMNHTPRKILEYSTPFEVFNRQKPGCCT